MNYKLTKLSDRVYVLQFDNLYDLGMHFVRYQEFYESSNPRFKGQKFTIIDFMEYYAKDFSKRNLFTYPKDWDGYNIPMAVISNVQNMGIDDFNKYDAFMLKLIEDIPYANECYILGSRIGDLGTMEHEIAHSLYFTNPEYKKEMLSIIESLPQEYIDDLIEYLARMGYHSDVYYDEIQAFMSTGSNLLTVDRRAGFDICKNLNKVFTKYASELMNKMEESSHADSSSAVKDILQNTTEAKEQN